MNNILQILSRNNIPDDECDIWAKATYYMFDLFLFESDKKMYKDFLENKRGIKVL